MSTLVIYDEEKDYAKTLFEYFEEKKGLPFKVYAFSRLEELKKFLEDTIIDVLLTSRVISDPHIRKMVHLSEGDSVLESEDIAIYKYQSAETIFKEMMEQCVSQMKDLRIGSRSCENKAQIIGVYSPVGRSGKTSFAITMGQILRNKGPALYINLEEFSGFCGLFNRNYNADLADLMYHYKQEPASIGVKLKAIVGEMHGMDYIPPMAYSGNIRNIDSEVWINLIEDIARLGMYEHVIVDFSNMVSDIPTLLDACDIIYTPLDNNRISMCKINEYEEYLLKTGRESIVNKTVKVKLPSKESTDWDEHYLEELVWGELGDFIKRIIDEEVA